MQQTKQALISVKACRGEVRDCIEILRLLLGALPYTAKLNQVSRHLAKALLELQDADTVIQDSLSIE
jgi:hypothetical protein